MKIACLHLPDGTVHQLARQLPAQIKQLNIELGTGYAVVTVVNNNQYETFAVVGRMATKSKIRYAVKKSLTAPNNLLFSQHEND